MKTFWRKWLVVSKKIVSIQANILLVIIYYIFIVPMGAIMQLLFKDSLLGHAHDKKNNSSWSKRKEIKHDLSWAREQ